MTHNPRTESGRVGDFLTLEDQQLTLDPLTSPSFFARMTCDNVERTDALTVETGVLGVRLAHEERDTSRNEVTDGPCVVVERSRRKSLET